MSVIILWHDDLRFFCEWSVYRSSLDNTIQVPYFVLDILYMQFYLFGRIRSNILVCPFVVQVYTGLPLQADTKQYPFLCLFVLVNVHVLRCVIPNLGLVSPRLTMQYGNTLANTSAIQKASECMRVNL